MSWKEKLIARILLLICRIVAEGDLRDELRHLSNHITSSRDEETR